MSTSNTRLFLGDTPIDFYYLGEEQTSSFPKTTPVATRSGLVFDVDATKVESYPGSGSVWYSIGGGPNLEPFTGSIVSFGGTFPTYDATEQALDFNNGVNTDVLIGHFTSSLSTSTQIWWAKLNSLDQGANGGGGITYGDNLSGGAMARFQSISYDEVNSEKYRLLNTAGGDSIFAIDAETSIDKYDLLVAVRQTNNYRFYKNGVLQGTDTSVTVTSYSNGIYVVGPRFIAATDNPLGRYSGLISRVAVYNRALSEDEINALYQVGRFGG